jgi:demethylmenaquinone methyltransferase / 2-methoxy-6-polyprenyl-1,4-benzoquinol methylase
MREGENRGPDSDRVREMFAAIAPRYDFLNHFLSASIDRRWRRAAVRKVRELVGPAPALCLDSCCGTGDLAIALQRGLRTRVIASDFCHPMLSRATAKPSAADIRAVEADALRLPFENEMFDAVTTGFGLRNLEDPSRGLQETYRVLRPGGAAVILEFSQVEVPVIREIYNLYFRYILPRLGAVVSGDAYAYQYLPDSVRRFPAQKELAEMMRARGFREVEYRNLMGGAVALHWGRR